MRALFASLMLGLCALGAASCGASECFDVCTKIKNCGGFPSTLGADVNACSARCREAPSRTQEPTRACVDSSTCADIKGGRCAAW